MSQSKGIMDLFYLNNWFAYNRCSQCNDDDDDGDDHDDDDDDDDDVSYLAVVNTSTKCIIMGVWYHFMHVLMMWNMHISHHPLITFNTGQESGNTSMYITVIIYL